MNIRWMAVLTGFVVDLVATTLLFMIAFPQTIFTSQALDRNEPLAIFLGLLATGIGGYVAGRMGPAQRWLHGFLVGVVGILMIEAQVLFGGEGLSRVDVFALAAGCIAGALGAILSRFPAERRVDL
ncbi:MAG TPA: TIGR04086 family membrane protein [Roseiflexaceae bacterium]|nr:TIGR04086 family membrane protein [Roseiflexaceae bacterium]